MSFWLGVWALVAEAAANTEAISFTSKVTQTGLEPDTPLKGTITAGHNASVAVAQPGAYFCKICWPASQPADFYLDFNGSHVLIATRDAAYPVAEADRTVQYELLLSSQWFGIPRDVVKIIFYVLGALCTGLWLSRR